MQFSQDLRAAIEGAVRRLVGADRVVEVGFRAAANGEPVCNGLLWPSDAELQDERLLEDVERIEECPEHPGLASLDLYIRSEHGIETNCYAFVRDGGLAGITTEWAGDCREVGLRCLGVVPFAEEE